MGPAHNVYRCLETLAKMSGGRGSKILMVGYLLGWFQETYFLWAISHVIWWE